MNNYKPGQKIIAFAPATVANVGPCFDIMGYCLDFLGDFAEITFTKEQGTFNWKGVIGPLGPALERVPKEKNAAYVVAKNIWDKFYDPEKHNFGIDLTLLKYMPFGSGFGSSAASGVAAGKIMEEALSLELTPAEMVDELAAAEEVTSGHRHFDNVAPSYLGGFCLITPDGVSTVKVKGLFSVIVKPDVAVATSLSRNAVSNKLIETYLSHKSKKDMAADVLKLVTRQTCLSAQMIAAAKDNDVLLLGKTMDDNELLESARGSLIPHFHEVKEAAKKAGAFGCTISGSGPSTVAITDSLEKAKEVKKAMIAVYQKNTIKCNSLISKVNNKGAKLVKSVDYEVEKGQLHHDFYE